MEGVGGAKTQVLKVVSAILDRNINYPIHLIFPPKKRIADTTFKGTLCNVLSHLLPKINVLIQVLIGVK